MRILILVFIISAASACGFRRELDTGYMLPQATTAAPSPTPEDNYLEVPKKAARALTKKQKKELDSTLPPKVREVLEKAETLEVLGLSTDDKAGIGWYPDLKARLPLGADRTELLTSFYYNASAGPNPSACFIPRHGLKATYKGKTVDVIICYECHLFVVEGDLGQFDGGVYKDGSAALMLFQNILRTKNEPIK